MRRADSGIRRSIRLLKAFRREDSDPDLFSRVVADDTVSLVAGLCEAGHVGGLRVVDIGGASGYVAEALRSAGARALTLEYDPENMNLGDHRFSGGVRGDGRALPFASGSVDLCYSSNVIEHVAGPARMLEEMVRVVRPGGKTIIAFTNWWSPWGGHETSPWHYLGGKRAARIYRRRYGREPKNCYGRNLFRLGIGDALTWARSNRATHLVTAFPRYYPWWCSPIVRIPGIREVATWNLVIVLEKLPRPERDIAPPSGGPTGGESLRDRGQVPGTGSVRAGRLDA